MEVGFELEAVMLVFVRGVINVDTGHQI